MFLRRKHHSARKPKHHSARKKIKKKAWAVGSTGYWDGDVGFGRELNEGTGAVLVSTRRPSHVTRQGHTNTAEDERPRDFAVIDVRDVAMLQCPPLSILHKTLSSGHMQDLDNLRQRSE